MPSHLQDASSARRLSITVDGTAWQLQVYRVSRVGHDLFVHALVSGPRTFTAVVHVAARLSRRDVAREVLSLLRRWLASGDSRDHIFLESSGLAGAPC